jgi:hypothetical protein
MGPKHRLRIRLAQQVQNQIKIQVPTQVQIQRGFNLARRIRPANKPCTATICRSTQSDARSYKAVDH